MGETVTRDPRLTIRMDDDTRDRLERAAALAALTLSEWARAVLETAAAVEVADRELPRQHSGRRLRLTKIERR